MKISHFTRCARTIAALSLLICVSGWASAQTTRGITAEDYFSFEFASDPNISPDGKMVAYVT